MEVTKIFKYTSGFALSTAGISAALIGSALARKSAAEVFPAVSKKDPRRSLDDYQWREIGKTLVGVTIASLGVVVAANGIQRLGHAPFCSFLGRLPWLV